MSLEEHFDVLVIGAGTAGIAAATAAAQTGARVALIDKSDRSGGPGPAKMLSSIGLFAVGTRLQRELHIDLDADRAFHLFMDHTHWKVDARLVAAYINNSAATVEWLSEFGIEFNTIVPYFTGAEHSWHFRERPNNPFITDALWERAQTLGTILRLNTKVQELLTKDGGVVGVRAEGPEGEHTYLAGSTILATGGIAGNAEMIEEFTGFRVGVDFFPFPSPDLQGEGLRLAWKVGAARRPIVMESYASLPDDLPGSKQLYSGAGGTAPRLGSLRQPNLIVNQNGHRVADETILHNPGSTGSLVRRQPGGYAYMIMSEGIERRYREHGWDIEIFMPTSLRAAIGAEGAGHPDLRAGVQDAIDDGYRHLFAAESVEDLARQLGIPSDQLSETIRTYDEACATGRDAQFHKDAKYLNPIASAGPFYAARFFNTAYGSAGGLAIDDTGRVLDAADRPISGLYAAGRDANTLYGDSYPFFLAGNNVAFSYGSGRAAGGAAAKYAATRP